MAWYTRGKIRRNTGGGGGVTMQWTSVQSTEGEVILLVASC